MVDIRLFFGKEKTDKSGKSTGWKVFAVGAATALIALTAFAGTVASQDSGDWPYEGLNAVGYDSADEFEHFTLGGVYAPGSTVTVKATAKGDYEDAVIIDVYDSLGTKIATNDFGPIPGETEEFDVILPADGPQGYYEIRANGLETDFFTVEGVPIPEFSTVAIHVASILGLLYLFRRRGARKKIE